MNEQRQTIVFSIAEYIKKLWTWMPVIISWSVFFAMLAITLKTVLIKPCYSASTSIYILDREVQSDYERFDMSDIQVSTQMTNDGMAILKSEQMAERVIANLKNSTEMKYDLTASELLEMVTVSREDDSLMVTISVNNQDPYIACDLANTYREVATRELEEKIKAKGVQTIEEAIIPIDRIGGTNLVYGALGLIAGAFIACVALLILYVKYDAKRILEDIKEV